MDTATKRLSSGRPDGEQRLAAARGWRAAAAGADADDEPAASAIASRIGGGGWGRGIA